MPIPLAANPSGGSIVDDIALLRISNELAELKPRKFLLELTWGIRGQGGASQYKFGDTAAALRMAFRSTGYPVEMVSAQRWKTRLRIRGDKSASVAAALKAFPLDTEYFVPKRGVWTAQQVEGNAEAALIALYGKVAGL